MHPVLGTMMPEICEAPHLSDFPFIHHCAPDLMLGMRSSHSPCKIQIGFNSMFNIGIN